MKTSTKLVPIVAIVFLVGCDGMNHTEQNVIGGAAIGAAGGALVGAAAHGAGWGALIGAGVGAVGGYIYDQSHYDDDYYY